MLVQTALLAAALALSAGAIDYFTARHLEENAGTINRDTARLVDSLIHRDIEQAALYSRLISEDYQVKVELRAEREGGRADEQLVHRRLNETLKSVSADFLSLAHTNGVVFLHESRRDVRLGDRPAVENEPLFLSPAFQDCVETGRPAVGVEPVYPGALAVVAIAPVRHNREIIGYVRLGYRLDRRFVDQVRDITRTHVLVIHRGVVAASTLAAPRTPPDAEKTLQGLRSGYLLHSSPIRNRERAVATLVTAYPRSRIDAVRRGGTFIIVAVALIAFAVSVPAAWRLARLIVRPLGRLMDGVHQLESGDLAARIEPAGDDEIGRLAQSFNTMTDSLRARDEEIRRNQDQLIESGKLAAIGELAAGVAHEIGNPLAAISGYIQLLKENPPQAKARHFFEEMEKEVGFIDTTIRELLDFSRPARTEEQSVALNEIVDECLRMLSFHKAIKGVRIEKTLSADNPAVLGSRKELLQALLNLTLNGAQAMPDGGTLSIRVETGAGVPPGRVGLFVSDQGEGIAPELLGKIFDPFFTTKRSGTGLGLSITYRIVQRHQGEIFVDSNPGRGVTFKIILPMFSEGPGDTL